MIKNLEEIKDNINIIEIIESYIPLRKMGANYLSQCPFHDENTPSFVANARKNIFHCFGCNEGGNGIDFIMKYERVDFKEAVKIASRICGIEIHEDIKLSKDEIEAVEIKERLEDLAEESYKYLLSHEKLCKYLATRGFYDKNIKCDIDNPRPLYVIIKN